MVPWCWCHGVVAVVSGWLGIKEPQAPLHLIEFTNRPWQRIHLDFAGHLQCHILLIIVISYFKWPEVVPVKTTIAGRAIQKLRNIFSRFGQNNCYQDNDPEEFLLNLTVETTILGQMTLQKDSYTLSEKAM